MAWRLIAALALVCLAVPGAATPVAASHQANCAEPADTNRWTGQTKGNFSPDGTSAYFDTNSLDMCVNPEPTWERSGSFAFVNVEGTHFNDIVQIGVGRCRFPFISQCTWDMEVYSGFGRHHSTSGCAGFSDVAPVVNWEKNYTAVQHNYKVWHTTNWWRMYEDGILLRSAIESGVCWTSKRSSWFAESFDIGDAHGGWSTNKYRISGAAFAVVEDGAFTGTTFNPAFDCNLGPGAPDVGGPPFFCDIVSSGNIDIWTTR